MIVSTNTLVIMNRVITLTSAMVTIAIIGIPRPNATAKMYESIITLLVLNSFFDFVSSNTYTEFAH